LFNQKRGKETAWAPRLRRGEGKGTLSFNLERIGKPPPTEEESLPRKKRIQRALTSHKREKRSLSPFAKEERRTGGGTSYPSAGG